MRFKDNDRAVCGRNDQGTKQETIVMLKHNIETAEARLMGYKKDKKALKRMYNKGYSYNHNHLQDIIGSCFIEIDKAKGDIEEYSKQLKKVEKN